MPGPQPDSRIRLLTSLWHSCISFAHDCSLVVTFRAQIYCLSGKGKNCDEKAKVGGRFSGRKVPFLTSIIAKKLRFSVREVETGGER